MNVHIVVTQLTIYHFLVAPTITHEANAVLLDNVETFYQNERIQNYLRTPIMKAPFGTNKYYYEDAFTLKATGTAYRCANGQAERSEG